MRCYKIFLLLLISSVSLGQINEKGLPFIRTFSPEEYDASDQNWVVVQDHRGIMYFGNNDRGVLEYDGKTWRKIAVPNNAPVRSLAVDSLGKVYVGASGEFGYLSPNQRGKLEYQSLTHLIEDSLVKILDIYQIHFHRGYVYFYTVVNLFQYDGTGIKIFNINPNQQFYNYFSFNINNHLYIGSFTAGLREFIDTCAVVAPNGDFFKHANIYSMTPYNRQWANMVTSKGIFRYNQTSGEVVRVKSWNDFYKGTPEEGAVPYNHIVTDNKGLGLSFIYGRNYGFTQADSLGNAFTVVNTSNGLQDDMIFNLYQNQNGNSPVWLCLNIGISRLDIHSQIRRFSEESGLKGSINFITQYNKTLFVGTMSGVFYKTIDPNGFSTFKQLNEINITAWSYLHFKDPTTGKIRLLIGGTGAVYEVKENFKVINISELPDFKGKIGHVGYSLHQSDCQPDIVYIGGSSLTAMKWERGQWKNLSWIKRDLLQNEFRSINSYRKNELWLATNLNGVTRVTFTDNDTIVQNYGLEDGLPGLKDNLITKIGTMLYFATEKGMYQFNDKTNRFEVARLPKIKGTFDGYGVNRVTEYQNGYAMACYAKDASRWVEIVELRSDSSFNINRKPFSSLPQRWADAIYADDDGTFWIAISTELFSYNSTINRNYDEPFDALIRKVTTKGDSILFEGAFIGELPNGNAIVSISQEQKQMPTLPYRFNSFIFDVASNFYEKEEQTEYSFILEGLDKEWSKWSADPKPIYTNLSEGRYTFRVKAKNIYGDESSIATYSFSITPPWYRSIVAYIAYVVLMALFIWGIVVLNTRRLIAEKERLEQIVRERTAEVVAQKEEIEHQRDKIFEQNEEIKSSISYASRIQGAILTPVETINTIFDDYFILFLPRDIVSGDFYWLTQVGNRKICAIADCTGHGVPGGFMSMLGMGYLTQIVSKDNTLTASQFLDQLRSMIITSLHQTGKIGESKDGMDIALYIIDTSTGMLEFAGANNPLVLIRDNEVIQVKGDKMPIGIHLRSDIPFTNNVMEYKKGDVLYTFSDGYADQFGGPDLRKFMIKNLRDLMLEVHKKPMAEQREIFNTTLEEWHGDSPRIDDVVLMGLRL